MTQIVVHSQNICGSLNYAVDLISSILESDCECTAILLQDMGLRGPEAPPILRQALGENQIVVNFSNSNKARNVGIIVHKSWNIEHVMKDQSGSLVGVRIAKGSLKYS